MRARLMKIMAGTTVLAAIGFGGATLASAQSSGQPSTPPPAQEQVTAPDGDSLQQGDQTTPDTGEAAEQPGLENESAAESGSEVVGNDGPGGHADEPGNPTADHQFQGVE